MGNFFYCGFLLLFYCCFLLLYAGLFSTMPVCNYLYPYLYPLRMRWRLPRHYSN